tara:strand:+ start:9114 stop:10991 length:1878 start_codon:yes stop_codon:yes gene_type:complete
MDDNFNERIFNEFTNDISTRLEKDGKSSKIKISDLENAINDMLNDETSLKKYNRRNIVKYSRFIKDEVNKTEFDINYLKSRYKKITDFNKVKLFVSDQVKDKANILKNIDYEVLIKNVGSSIMGISKDLVLLFFTVCIVAHLKIRSFIDSCYLYPSNPNRFPYIFYNSSSVKQKQLLNIRNFQNDSDTDPVFTNTKIYYNSDGTPSKEKNEKLNDMCFGSMDGKQFERAAIFKVATDILVGENENLTDESEKYYEVIQDIINKLSGITNVEKMEKLSSLSKTFMEEHTGKCKDELSIYSLITYVLYYNTLKNQESMGYLHTGFFKYLTSPTSKLYFGAMVILLYSIFKNNIKIANRFLNNVLDYYSDKYDGGGKLHSIFLGILSSILAPFITFALLLLMIVYPLSIFNCMKSYFNYVSLTNQVSTKIVCYLGMIYSVIALIAYSSGLILAIFPELIAYITNELKYMMQLYGGNKKGKGKHKKGKSKEGFSGEKGCSGGGFFKNFNIAKLLGVIIMSLLGLFLLMPVVLPFICAFISSFGVSASLTFDGLKFMRKNLCSVKEYSSIIKLLVIIMMGYQIINRYSNGSRRNKWISIIASAIVLLIYLFIEFRMKMTENYFDGLKCNI